MHITHSIITQNGCPFSLPSFTVGTGVLDGPFFVPFAVGTGVPLSGRPPGLPSYLKIISHLFVTHEKILHHPIDKSTFFVYTEKCEFFPGKTSFGKNFLQFHSTILHLR